MSADIAIKTDNIIAPIRSDMIEMTGSEEGMLRVASAFKIAVLENAGKPNKSFLDCDPRTIQRELLKCCADGLVPDGREAVILPYKKSANYQPMIHGIVKRLKELGSVNSITVELVHENDMFHVNLADQEDTKHEFDIFTKDRGDIVGAYAIFRGKDKSVMHREVMSRQELDKVRSASKSPDSPAWANWEGEMFKKAVIRRGSKRITINNDQTRLMIERMDEMFDFSPKQIQERADPFATKQLDSPKGNRSRVSQGEEEGSPTSQEPSSANPTTDDGHPPVKSVDGAGSGHDQSPDPASIDEKEVVSLDDIQDLSDYLWKSKRNAKDLRIDFDKFKADVFSKKENIKNTTDLTNQIKDIHKDRVSGSDEAVADKRAADRLVDLGIEVPEGK